MLQYPHYGTSREHNLNENLITIVRLHRQNRAALVSHFVSLEREDRRLRFGSGTSDDGLRQYVSRIDFERDGLFAVQDDSLGIIAVVHVACTRETAELGLSVVAGHRGAGIGNALFRRAITFLRNRGATSVFVHCLSENRAMMHLARKHSMRLSYGNGESDGQLEITPATADSYVTEWLEDQRGRMVQSMRQNARLAKVFFDAFVPQ